MTTRTQSGAPWFSWHRNSAFRAGLLIGSCLSGTLIAWLWMANRLPQLEAFAALRNPIAAAIAALLLSVPVVGFRSHPMKAFLAGETAWVLLSLVYRATELKFSLLESRMGAFHVFILGTICYGFSAVFQWVFLLCAKARHDYIVQVRQVAVSATRSRTH